MNKLFKIEVYHDDFILTKELLQDILKPCFTSDSIIESDYMELKEVFEKINEINKFFDIKEIELVKNIIVLDITE